MTAVLSDPPGKDRYVRCRTFRALEALGLARVKHLAPVPRIEAPRPAADLRILQAVILNRYDVLARFARSMKRAYAAELERMCRSSPEDARALKDLGPWLDRDEKMLRDSVRKRLDALLPKSPVLSTMVRMRRELAGVWARSAASREQLIGQLQDWCERAEASGIAPLAELSRRVRSYA